jgi:PleD family two-component response regulator
LTTNGNNNGVRPRRILLVDDDADIISTFKMILEMNGFEVDAYTSPLSAFRNIVTSYS